MANKRIQRLKGTTAKIAAMTPMLSEYITNTDNFRIHVGDGTTPGGHPLALLSDLAAGLNLKANSSHNHAFAEIPGLQAALTAKLDAAAKAADSALLNGQSAAQLPVSTDQATALNLKLDKNAQAADSAALGGETAAQWMDRITAGAYTPPTTSTPPVGAVALCILGNSSATSNNGANISGGQLRLAGMPSTMNIVDIQASSKVGVGGWQTGTWKNIHGENIGGSPGSLQFRSGYFVRTL